MKQNINPMLLTIEDEAAEIWEFKTEEIFKKTRKREVVEGRMAVMLYRYEKIKMSEAKAAQPYGLGHTAVIHARKTINILVESDKKFKQRYEDFLNTLSK